MVSALLGHTGLVGSTLARARRYDQYFTSTNIHEIEGSRYDLIVSAGVSAQKWLANKDPDADLASIQKLTERLQNVHAKHFVLISTIDVYGNSIEVDEMDTPVEKGLHPYGRHRLELERWVIRNFARVTIVRLPGLFGAGLRKNILFDMLNRNQTEQIAPHGVLQWYPLRRLVGDLDQVMRSDLALINIASEPIRTEEIHKLFFPDVTIGRSDLLAPRYDMRTRYAHLLGGEGCYHLSAKQVITELNLFINKERST